MSLWRQKKHVLSVMWSNETFWGWRSCGSVNPEIIDSQNRRQDFLLFSRSKLRELFSFHHSSSEQRLQTYVRRIEYFLCEIYLPSSGGKAGWPLTSYSMSSHNTPSIRNAPGVTQTSLKYFAWTLLSFTTCRKRNVECVKREFKTTVCALRPVSASAPVKLYWCFTGDIDNKRKLIFKKRRIWSLRGDPNKELIRRRSQSTSIDLRSRSKVGLNISSFRKWCKAQTLHQTHLWKIKICCRQKRCCTWKAKTPPVVA